MEIRDSFSAIFAEETIFITSCVAFLYTGTLLKSVYSKQNDFFRVTAVSYVAFVLVNLEDYAS